ncbi:hypothetical protein [Planobispora rosea]|uniref:hypothetical protein n=1 Tax=Planobispora rosea TaxID=35762 RepID=UPI00114CADE0|nr:hypothetical protein [Planobispora rosea]
MATGYERVRSVAALAADWEATREVRLELPGAAACSATAGSAAPAQRLGLTAAQHNELLGRIARYLPAHRTVAEAVLAAAADLAIPDGIAIQPASGTALPETASTGRGTGGRPRRHPGRRNHRGGRPASSRPGPLQRDTRGPRHCPQVMAS